MQPTNTSPSLRAYASATEVLSCARGGRRLNNATAKSADHLLSIVTVCYNSEKTISRTIDSIAAQTYPHIEYIVVDGGSTDRTVEILRSRQTDIDLWISERDHGISDAFNKGISLTRGEFIALVNSDDWVNPDHMECAIAALSKSDSDFVFGNLIVHGQDGSPLHVFRGDPDYRRTIRNAMPGIPHPSVVCRRTIYERLGLYRTDLRIAMDYEWLLRCHLAGVRGVYTPTITSHMDGGGISNKAAQQSLAEVREISAVYGYPRFLAWIRFVARVSRLHARILLEQKISPNFASRLRSLINSRYRHPDSQNSNQ
jgi:glycosyltransferase involved in cell wall biosynthesis